MAAMLMEIMTPDPTSCRFDARMTEVARLMRDEEIGDVLVVADDGTLVGIVTDRDLVVHGLAEGSAADATIDGMFTSGVATLSTRSSVQDAIDLMTANALRRVPIVDGGRAIGIVSLGDLAEDRDPESALGRISAAPASA